MPLTSTPKKTPEMRPDDSGVSTELSDHTGDILESAEFDHLNSCEKEEEVIAIENDYTYQEEDEANSFISILVDKVGGSTFKWIVIGLLCLLYAGYFLTAVISWASKKCEHDALPLIYLTIAALAIFTFDFVKSKFSEEIKTSFIIPIHKKVECYKHIMKWTAVIIPALGVLAIIVVSGIERPSNLMSMVGWTFCVLCLYVCSRAPRKVNWRPVLAGFALQFYFATFILKWDKGYKLFRFIGHLFTSFLSFSDIGATFVFGNVNDHFFAFKILPVIIFFSCVITMLYYMGVMQAIISKIAFVMRLTMGTTAAESLSAAGNIFVGQTEAPIMIRPFLAVMTRSEIHAVMVGGFATIAGAVMAAYIMKGVSATHLITASVMNAPTALAVSKLLYPELGHSKISKIQEIIEEKQPFNNVIEAAAAGASAAISLVANVGANLIAFVALLAFVNALVSWFGAFVCFPDLSFEIICGYALMPLAYIMGVEWKDAGAVARLIGIKTFLNEFVAYDRLTEMMKRRIECGAGQILSIRSEIIATYALCGFANLSSIGIQLGGLGPMAPNRLGDLAQIAFSALFGGIMTNLMTACVAGLLVIETPFDVKSCMNSTVAAVNTTFI